MAKTPVVEETSRGGWKVGLIYRRRSPFCVSVQRLTGSRGVGVERPRALNRFMGGDD